MSVNEIVLKERDTLKKTKTNEAQRRKQAENIRRRGLELMAEHDPSAAAKRQMRHKPYQVGVLIREQGEQMRREDVAEFVARKYGINAVKGEIAGGQRLEENNVKFENDRKKSYLRGYRMHGRRIKLYRTGD